MSRKSQGGLNYIRGNVMKIIICGDIHGEFATFKDFLNKQNPDIVLQCGDFGFWPNYFGNRRFDHKVYWVDGNHEDFHAIENRKKNEVWRNAFYVPRGTTMKLPDGRNVLFMGGARTPNFDRKHRTLGLNLFEQEMITQRDLDKLPDEKIDIVITHTAPKEFDIEEIKDNKWDRYDVGYDVCRDMLTVILNKYNPDRWVFGHYHAYQEGQYKNCKWTLLDRINNRYNNTWWLEI